jgi:hypothetical protein
MILRRLAPLAILLMACGAGKRGPHPLMDITQVLAAHTDRLMAIPGVLGVGQGEVGGRPAVQVLVEHDTPSLRSHLPDSLEGYPVQVVETGPIRAQPDTQP